MSRYRPPAAKKSPYITPVGMRALEQEQKEIWLRRREVVAALSAAAAEGDRSENAEYIYRKKELREIDRRIRYLQKRLPDLKVVEQKPGDRERVFFGATVTLELKGLQQSTFNRYLSGLPTPGVLGVISLEPFPGTPGVGRPLR